MLEPEPDIMTFIIDYKHSKASIFLHALFNY